MYTLIIRDRVVKISYLGSIITSDGKNDKKIEQRRYKQVKVGIELKQLLRITKLKTLKKLNIDANKRHQSLRMKISTHIVIHGFAP